MLCMNNHRVYKENVYICIHMYSPVRVYVHPCMRIVRACARACVCVRGWNELPTDGCYVPDKESFLLDLLTRFLVSLGNCLLHCCHKRWWSLLLFLLLLVQSVFLSQHLPVRLRWRRSFCKNKSILLIACVRCVRSACECMCVCLWMFSI